MSAAYRLDGRPASREAFYAAACDPQRHVCVEACAGAGKTWMLVARIVRALLDGAQPHEILAITFTRKAAGEMRTRLNDWLREASVMTPAQAAAKLREFGLDAVQAEQRAAALIGLHERVLDSGRTVAVHTMHAWYAQLLAAAPLDLLADIGLGPGLTPLEDRSDLMPALMQRLHCALLTDEGLRADHRHLTVRHGRFNLVRWFEAALERRGEIELADAAGVLEASVPTADEPDAAARVRDPGFRATAQSLAFELGQRATQQGQAEKAARGLINALSQDDARAAYWLFRAALFTEKGNGSPRRQLGELPQQALLCDTLDRIAPQIAQQEAHEDHLAMVRLSRRLFALYAQLKRERGFVDMNDLEQVARALLSEHEAAAWVQQRLDARVRHLLIDEFQDTSALQWHALQGWLAAYAGAGGGAQAPRLFIVGDPKQSIYRFRRADPRVFAAAQDFVVEALDGSIAACDHTRRCAPGVVTLLNRLFGDWTDFGDVPGLAHWRDHTTEIVRDTATPVLAVLPSIERPASGGRAAEAPRVWRPSLTVPKTQATALLREAEADEVARAVAHLIVVEGVASQDILVLARKRAVLTLVADALARTQVPHVAPEDLLLSQLPEVQDLLALLDVLASSTQSLSLARALKSPLFGASDADLLDLSRRAGGALAWWSALLRCADDASASPALQRAARLCAAWAAVATTLPPHDLLDRIVHEGELLPRLAAVVPEAQHARALDAVRALLAAALELDGGRYASPYAFVRALRARRIEAPASQQADAVRLLTIHGAKGLEARAVFLVDTQSEPPRRDTMAVLVEWPVDSTRPRRVAFVASLSRCAPSLAALVEEEKFEGAREEANALYVALTRARERLVISRTPPHHKREPSWWARLEPWAQAWAASAVALPDTASGVEVVALPPPLQIATPPPSDHHAVPADDDSVAAALGRAVHRVLEWAAQPGAATPPDFGAAARAAARAFGVADARAVRAVAERIWASAACRRFFEAESIAWAGNEVSVAAADGAPRRIDRLVLLREPERAWWVLDYKLAGDPQNDAVLRAQLADYRRAVAALVPGEVVHAAFITGAGQLVIAE